MRVGTEAEVLDGLTGILGATEEEGVGTGRGAHGQLIDGQGLTAGSDNAGTGGVGVAQGGNRQLGELQETVVVGDGADQDDGLALVSLAGVLVGSGGNDLGERHGGAVDLAHHQAAEDSGVELAVGTAFAQKMSALRFWIFVHLFAARVFGTSQQQPVESCFSMHAESAAGGVESAVASRSAVGEVVLTAQESVELDEQSSVGVVRLGCLAVARTDMVLVKIDTHVLLVVDREVSCRFVVVSSSRKV